MHKKQKEAQLPWFARFAHEIARLAGKPIIFLICLASVLIWAATGPYFHYSDT